MIKITCEKGLLLRYMSMSPLALAFERYMECKIFRHLELDRPILDLGCGEGLFAHILFKEKIDTGIDPNLRELKRARQLSGYEELIKCKAEAVPKPSGSYQTIFANSVLEHIHDLSPIFDEVHRLLGERGRFFMTVPAPEFEHYTICNQVLMFLGMKRLAAWYRGFCSRFIWKHRHYKSISGWKEIASKHGFTVVNAVTYNSKKMCLVNDFLYPFSILALIKKRLFNRWMLFTSLRRIFIFPQYLIARHFFENDIQADDGGLVFLALKKTGDI